MIMMAIRAKVAFQTMPATLTTSRQPTTPVASASTAPMPAAVAGPMRRGRASTA